MQSGRVKDRLLNVSASRKGAEQVNPTIAEKGGPVLTRQSPMCHHSVRFTHRIEWEKEKEKHRLIPILLCLDSESWCENWIRKLKW